MNSKLHRLLGPISVMVSLLILGIVLLNNTQYIPLRYRLILATVILIAVLVVLILTKKPYIRYLLTTLILVLSLVLVSSARFFTVVSESKEYELIRYDLIGKEEQETYERVGYFGVRSEQLTELQPLVEETFAIEEWIAYDDVYVLIEDIKNGTVDGMVVNDNLIADIVILQEDFLKTFEIVNHFDVSVSYELQAKEVDVSTEPFVVYVSGIDIYGDVVTRSRSDLNLLLVVNPVSKEILTVSIPRDTYLPLGCETGANDKLTHAGLYGIQCSVKTIENAFDIEVNYYFRINFTGLVEIINSLNGVNVYSNYTFTTENGYSFVEGYNEVDGDAALAFARERDNVAAGDVDRGLHHQELVKAIFEKATQVDELANLPRLLRLLQSVIDTNFGDDNFSNIISMQMEYKDQWIFHSDYLKGVGDMQPTYSQDSRYKYYVYWPDADSVAEIKEQIADIIQVE